MESRLLLTVFLLLVISLPVSAGAAMYAYVDARGICHYTNAPGDGRYKLSERDAATTGVAGRSIDQNYYPAVE